MTSSIGATVPKRSRVLAEQMNDAIAREMMLRVASNYERIADQAVARAETRQA